MDLPSDMLRYHHWDDEPPMYGNVLLPSFHPFHVSVVAPRPLSSLASSRALPAMISCGIDHVVDGD
jgi:hypothetical protein